MTVFPLSLFDAAFPVHEELCYLTNTAVTYSFLIVHRFGISKCSLNACYVREALTNGSR